MAFSKANFEPLGRGPNRKYAYTSTDIFDTILADQYFDDVIDEDVDPTLAVGALIEVTCNTGVTTDMQFGVLKVVGISNTAGTYVLTSIGVTPANAI